MASLLEFALFCWTISENKKGLIIDVFYRLATKHPVRFTSCQFLSPGPFLLRDGPLENLWGGGGAGEVQKKKFAQGKIKLKKILAGQLILKKYSCFSLKKIHTRNLMTKKNSCGSKILLPPPPPRITFLMVRPTRFTPMVNTYSNFNTSHYKSSSVSSPGGHLGIFWVGMCRPGLQISTPF